MGCNHFHGKKPLEHLVDAHRKGQAAMSEIHGAELAGHYSAAADSAKETAMLFAVVWTLFGDPTLLAVFLATWLLWRTGRSALLGWRRLERLHRLIEEERWEIEHRRAQEKEELRALYSAKGFSGKLLDEVIEVLMADDNRLLQVMLEEELGVSVEFYEHPLKQAVGSALGVLAAAGAMAGLHAAMPASWMPWSLLGSAALVVGLSAGIVARLEKNQTTPAVIWNVAVAALSIGCAHFLQQFLS